MHLLHEYVSENDFSTQELAQYLQAGGLMAIWITAESELFYGTEQEYLEFMGCPSFEHCLGLLPVNDKPSQLIEQIEGGGGASVNPQEQKTKKKRRKVHAGGGGGE